MKKLKPHSREWNICVRLLALIFLMLIVIVIDIAAVVVQSKYILDFFKLEIFLMYVIYINILVCAVTFALLISIYLIAVKNDDK